MFLPRGHPLEEEKSESLYPPANELNVYLDKHDLRRSMTNRIFSLALYLHPSLRSFHHFLYIP